MPQLTEPLDAPALSWILNNSSNHSNCNTCLSALHHHEARHRSLLSSEFDPRPARVVEKVFGVTGFSPSISELFHQRSIPPSIQVSPTSCLLLILLLILLLLSPPLQPVSCPSPSLSWSCSHYHVLADVQRFLLLTDWATYFHTSFSQLFLSFPAGIPRPRLRSRVWDSFV